MDLNELKFMKHFSSQYHNNDITAMWDSCKKVFGYEQNEWQSIVRDNNLHGRGMVNFRIKNIFTKIGIDPIDYKYSVKMDITNKKFLVTLKKKQD